MAKVCTRAGHVLKQVTQQYHSTTATAAGLKYLAGQHQNRVTRRYLNLRAVASQV